MPRTEQVISMDLDDLGTVTAAQDAVLANAGRNDIDMHVKIKGGEDNVTLIIRSEMLYMVGIQNEHGQFLAKRDISYTQIPDGEEPGILEKEDYKKAVAVLSKVESQEDLGRDNVYKSLVTTIFLSSEAAKEETARNATSLALSTSAENLQWRTAEQREMLTWSNHLPVMQSWDKIRDFNGIVPSTMVSTEHVKNYYRNEFVEKDSRISTNKLKILGVLDNASLLVWEADLTAKRTAEAAQAAAMAASDAAATADVIPVTLAQIKWQEKKKNHEEAKKLVKKEENKRIPIGQRSKVIEENETKREEKEKNKIKPKAEKKNKAEPKKEKESEAEPKKKKNIKLAELHVIMENPNRAQKNNKNPQKRPPGKK